MPCFLVFVLRSLVTAAAGPPVRSQDLQLVQRRFCMRILLPCHLLLPCCPGLECQKVGKYNRCMSIAGAGSAPKQCVGPGQVCHGGSPCCDKSTKCTTRRFYSIKKCHKCRPAGRKCSRGSKCCSGNCKGKKFYKRGRCT
eukprot:IDg4523t1